MDLDRDNTASTTRTGDAFATNDGMNTTGMNNLSSREDRVYDRDSGGSNFLAFLIGGLVIAVGLLAFLFYDGGNRDVNTTSSTTTQTERPAGTTGSTGTTAAPPAGAGSTTAPATPARPATPAQ
jgi:hypothetical protein